MYGYDLRSPDHEAELLEPSSEASVQIEERVMTTLGGAHALATETIRQAQQRYKIVVYKLQLSNFRTLELQLMQLPTPL